MKGWVLQGNNSHPISTTRGKLQSRVRMSLVQSVICTCAVFSVKQENWIALQRVLRNLRVVVLSHLKILWIFFLFGSFSC